MRYIAKHAEPPQSIREWREVQLPVGLNLDYRNFNDKPALRKELTAGQLEAIPRDGVDRALTIIPEMVLDFIRTTQSTRL